MEKCDIDHSDYKNNGLITKIWGGPGWKFCHSITFGYPLEPTPEQKKHYKNFFFELGYVLPCRYCRESYQKFISTGETALTDEVLENRETLTHWFYRVHQAVNQKLDIDYGVSYKDMVEIYESFRARCGPTSKGCVAPLDYKAFSYRKLYQYDAPILCLDMVKPFIELAEIRGLPSQYFSFLELAEYLNGDFSQLKKLPIWHERNKLCHEQIIYMQINAIDSVETNGLFKGLPTVDELVLIMYCCSNLSRTEVRQLLRTLDKWRNKYYNYLGSQIYLTKN